ncbi:MAG: tight adherence protein, partial [Actinomycetota bacterium]|nr:tight adherence protein [Actinomycetota bacterium]
MGALLGLVLGVGLMLIWRSGSRRAVKVRRNGPTMIERIAEMLAQAGIESVTPRQLIASSAGLSFVVFLMSAALSRTVPIAVAFATFAAFAPVSLVRYRQRKRRTELRDLWPEAVDNLASAVRAGLSLPEALTQLGVRGPEELRRPFQRFGEDYRASGRFSECLDRLKAGLADPTGDRIVESLRMAREVGGTDLGRLLRTLSAFLREDARTRAELETRQGWSVNGARIAEASPWILLAALSLHPEAVQA